MDIPPVIFAVLENNVKTNDCNILFTCYDEKLAVDFINKIVNKKPDFQDSYWYSKNIEDEKDVTIYEKQRFPWSKTPIYKYLIKTFFAPSDIPLN